MAWIEEKKRRDGGLSARVLWRLGGTREGAYQSETFSAGSDAQNVARAEGFKKMVEAAGQRWPDGWVKGEGFVRPEGEPNPLKTPPGFDEIGEEYPRQIVDLSPGQRKRYLGQLKVLANTRVRGTLVFAQPVTRIADADVKDWLKGLADREPRDRHASEHQTRVRPRWPEPGRTVVNGRSQAGHLAGGCVSSQASITASSRARARSFDAMIGIPDGVDVTPEALRNVMEAPGVHGVRGIGWWEPVRG